MKKWYYVRDQQQYGPVSKSELLDLIESGDLDRENLVWTSGMEDWQPARSADELLTSIESQSPPPVPATGTSETHSKDSDASGIDHEESPPTIDSDLKYASFWKRLLAFAIDFIVLAFVSLFVVGMSMLEGSTPAEVESLANGLGIIVAWLYYAGMESSGNQATLGKMALGMRVTDENGSKVGFGKATGRHFGKIISGMILLIGYIMAVFTQKKQALHDIMAGCVVIDA